LLISGRGTTRHDRIQATLPTDTPVAIRTIDLTKSYRSGDTDLVIFERLNLEIPQGERLALIGESGAGKSTLLHLLGGLDRPNHGRIVFGGQEITSLGQTELADFRNRQIGFVWQTHHLLPEFSALENVMMPLLMRGVRRPDAVPKAQMRLEQMGLRARATHRAGELSGGEQQRVAIARALVTDPQVLLADEPTGNLDHKTGEKIADLFNEVHYQNRITSVFVTHNIGFARRCDRIVRLENGSLIEEFSRLASNQSDNQNIEEGAFAGLQGEQAPMDTARGEDGKNYV
jgi:lipoprotein-releasing system ATP-binding protein